MTDLGLMKNYPLFCFIANKIIIIAIKKYLKVKIPKQSSEHQIEVWGIPDDGTWFFSPKINVLMIDLGYANTGRERTKP